MINNPPTIPPDTLQMPKHTASWSATFKLYLRRFGLIFQKIIIVLLFIDSADALRGALNFLIIEYPALNQALETNQLVRADIIDLIAFLVVTLLDITLSAIILVSLFKMARKSVAKFLDLVIAVFFLTISPIVQSWLAKTSYLQTLFDQMSQLIGSLV